MYMGVPSGFLSEEDNKKFFIRLMNDEDRKQFESFSSIRTDAGHSNKRYIIYKHDPYSSTGITPLFSVRVTDFVVSTTKGVRITLENEMNGDFQTISHIPVRLFNSDVFIFAPPYQRLKYETFSAPSSVKNNNHTHSLSFSITVCTASRSSHKKEGDTFCETPTELSKLYPDLEIII
jgi:hypothetical protein